MNSRNDEILKSLVGAGLVKCLLKMARAGSGTWELAGIGVSTAAVPEAVRRGKPDCSVHIDVAGGAGFSAALLFNKEDLGLIAGCFAPEPLAGSGRIEHFGEVMLVELGNILLNALINSILNALKRCAIPSVPMYTGGGPGRVAAGLGTLLDLKRPYRIIAAALAIKSGGRASRVEALAILPEELAEEIGLSGTEAEKRPAF